MSDRSDAPGPSALARQLAWLVMAPVVIGAAIVPAAIVAGALPDASSRLPFLASFHGSWVLVAGAGLVLLAGQFLNGAVSRRTWLIAVAGAAASALAAAGLVSWSEATYGRFDPEFVGSTWPLPFLVGAAAVALASVTVTGGLARLLSALVAGATLLWLLLLAALNIGGAGSSVGEHSWGLVAAFVTSALFIVFALGLVINRPMAPGRERA